MYLGADHCLSVLTMVTGNVIKLVNTITGRDVKSDTAEFFWAVFAYGKPTSTHDFFQVIGRMKINSGYVGN